MEDKKQYLIQVMLEKPTEVIENRFLMTQGVSLLEALLEAGVPIDHSCGGNASCGTCLVSLTSNLRELPPRTELEQEMATDRGFSDQERLACQLSVQADLSVKIKLRN